jgi:hypothetical protein
MPSLVFTSPDRAIEIDYLRRAIESSKTWGEFRQRIGREEYVRLYKYVFFWPDEDDDLDEDMDEEEPEPTPDEDDDPEDIDEEDQEPADDAAFSSGDVPGYFDGDYPPWLAAEMDCYVPTEILQRFATLESSALNGDFYNIDITQREGILKALAEVGFTVEERQDLQFW